MKDHETYLGDGVSAYKENGALWLTTERQSGTHSICLEEETYEALTEYVDRLSSEARSEAKKVKK